MITSPANPTLKRVRALQERRAAREQEGAFVVEGLRLVGEAVATGLQPLLVLHTAGLDERGETLLRQLAASGVAPQIVSPAVLRQCSDTQSPAGLLAVFPLPRLPLPPRLTFALILDRVADPGNLGTILRTAAAAGAQAAFLSPGTVDAFNPKVVRGGMGAHFRLPILAAGWDEIAGRLAGLQVWLADAAGGTPYDRVDWRAPSGLIVGGEAEGAGPEARALASSRVSIPMPGRAESLNAAVAAGILLFEIARQRAGASG